MKRSKNIYLATIPKAGTHLLLTTLNEMDVKVPLYSKKPLRAANPFHLLHHTNNRFDLDIHEIKKAFPSKNKYIVMIRDPRDYFVSRVFWIEKQLTFENWSEKDKQDIENWSKQPFEERVMSLINGGVIGSREFNWDFNNYYLAEKIMKANLSNFLFIKFEDLLPPHLGGDKQKAVNAVKKIQKFCNKKLSEEEIEKVINADSKNSFTFRQTKNISKINQWKNYFSDKNKEDFYKKHTELLESFGYEHADMLTRKKGENL